MKKKIFTLGYFLLMVCFQMQASQLEVTEWRSNFLKNQRQIWIYTPNDYSKTATPYPLLLVFDGQAYKGDWIPLPTILDKLTGQKAIPPVVAVFISSIDQSARNRELPCYPPFVDFLAKELLPWIHTHYNVAQDPSKTLLIGSSYGGLAACFAASIHPELFGNVLSQSGAFWWNHQAFLKRWEQLPKLPLRFYLDVGMNEEGEMLTLNRSFQDHLKSQGYSIYYVEFPGGHEYHDWGQAISNGLIYLLK